MRIKLIYSIPVIIYFFCYTFADAQAQVIQDSSYFPLALGNQWIYATGNGLSADTETVADTQRVNGRLYYGFTRHPAADPYLWFRNDGDKVYVTESVIIPQDSMDIVEYLIYNFAAVPGETARVDLSRSLLYCDYGGIIGMERIVDSVVTPAGTFRNCPVFYHDSGCRDAGISGEYFAAGTGRIQINRVTYFGGLSYILTEAILTTTINKEDSPQTIDSYHLFQNYPNPFNPLTNIVFQTPQQSHVMLEIYNIVGQRLKTLVNGELQAGRYSVVWNAVDQPSGIYFCKMITNNFSRSVKLILIR
jgi:Secretion system C-terminal sorting domain